MREHEAGMLLSRPPRISRTRAMTRAARSGKCCSSHCWNSGFTSKGRRSTMLNARLAPAAAAASRMRSSSGSLRKGMTGDTLTPTGTPACTSVSMQRRRRCGEAARGSITRASAGSSVVIET